MHESNPSPHAHEAPAASRPRATTFFLHGFAHTRALWHPIRQQLREDTEALRIPFHEAEAQSSFAAAVDALWLQIPQPEPVRLVGYSMGGRLALAMALRHPERVSHLHLLGAHPGLRSADERAARRASDRHWQAVLTQQGLDDFWYAWLAQPLFASQANLAPAAQTHAQKARQGLEAQALAASFDVLGLGQMPSTWTALPNLQVETTLWAGAKDTKFAALAKQMQVLLPHATCNIVADAGHNLVLEAQDALLAALRQPSTAV